jgi:hypothetical protein
MTKIRLNMVYLLFYQYRIAVTILPWWRLEHIVTNMKPCLQSRNYGIAIIHAVHDISNMLLTGPGRPHYQIGSMILFHDLVHRLCGIYILFWCVGGISRPPQNGGSMPNKVVSKRRCSTSPPRTIRNYVSRRPPPPRRAALPMVERHNDCSRMKPLRPTNPTRSSCLVGVVVVSNKN